MTTVTGLTAARMLEIEAASVVDGDVIGGNLILTKHDGSTINAGPVTGPQGPAGPIGQDLAVFSSRPILDVGLANQIRAGRQLALADFTNMGLNPPVGLWNLSDLTDASGNARTLINKGAIPFDVGINGIANTAVRFVGSAAQALYISDTGANDPFRIKTGSMGAWTRTAKLQSVNEQIIAKWSTAAGQAGPCLLYILGTTNVASFCISTTGSDAPAVNGLSNVADDKWHFIIGTYDGTTIKIYVDGVLEGTALVSGTMFGGSGPFNIGSIYGDGATAVQQMHFGRIDEAFVTADVLTDDQVRNLYCAKIPHTLSTTPTRVSVNVRRRRKGAVFTPADFPTQPLRLHNFSAGSLGDEGSNGVGLTQTNMVFLAGADGSSGNAASFNGNASMYSTDAGLPSGTNARSYGLWFKTVQPNANRVLIFWGTPGSGGVECWVNANGLLNNVSGSDNLLNLLFVADNQWHLLVVSEDNTAADGIKRKVYLDGRVVASSTGMGSLILRGANNFCIGLEPPSTGYFIGQMDTVFVCGYALTSEQIATLYAKGSQSLGISPKNPGDHVEAIRATDLLATFDTLESQHQIDLAVA